MTKSTKKKATVKKKPTAKTMPKALVKKAAIQPSDEKRLARNAALRAWRKANRARVNEYNRAWHAAKKTSDDKNSEKASRKDAQTPETGATDE